MRLLAAAIAIVLLSILLWLLLPDGAPTPQPDIALPSSDALAARIAEQLNGEQFDPSAELDAAVDSELLAARLAALTRTVTTQAVPSDQQLGAYLEQHRDRYRQTDFFSFDYLHFSALEYGAATRDQAQAALAALRAGSGVAGQVERLQESSQHALDQQFGRGFAAELASLWPQRPPSCWQGPLSGRGGLYLVCLRDYRAGALPSVEALRDQLINDWRFEQLRQQQGR